MASGTPCGSGGRTLAASAGRNGRSRGGNPQKAGAGLIGVDTSAWLLVFAYGIAIALVATARRPDESGARIGGFLVVPLSAGLAATILLLLAFPAATREVASQLVGMPRALVVAAGLLLVAVAVVDFALGRVLAIARRVLRWVLSEHRADVAALSAVSIALSLATVAAPLLAAGDLRATTAAPEGVPRFDVEEDGWSVLEAVQVPAAPLDLAVSEQGTFVSLADGRLLALDESDLAFRTVWEGLAYPRGLTVADDVLLVAELGPLPCDPPFPWCTGHYLDPEAPERAEAEIIESSEGQVRAFGLTDEGTLTDTGTVIEDLPVTATDHGLNGMVTGPDGLAYLAIGNIDFLWDHPDLVASIDHPSGELLGTVVRFAPDGGGLEVFARGLRNVYGLAFDPAGRLYGVDNDGETRAGWRMEEVQHLTRGGHYGYPEDGTFGQYSARTEPPLWTLDSKGSAGLLWHGAAGEDGGLLIGSCDKLERLGVNEEDGRPTVAGRRDEQVVATVDGCVVAIDETDAGHLLVAVYAYDEQRHALYLLDPPGER